MVRKAQWVSNYENPPLFSPITSGSYLTAVAVAAVEVVFDGDPGPDHQLGHILALLDHDPSGLVACKLQRLCVKVKTRKVTLTEKSTSCSEQVVSDKSSLYHEAQKFSTLPAKF